MSFIELTDAYEWTDDCPECDGHGETRDHDGDFDKCDHPGAVWTGARCVIAPTPDLRLLAAIQWPRGVGQ